MHRERLAGVQRCRVRGRICGLGCGAVCYLVPGGILIQLASYTQMKGSSPAHIKVTLEFQIIEAQESTIQLHVIQHGRVDILLRGAALHYAQLLHTVAI